MTERDDLTAAMAVAKRHTPEREIEPGARLCFGCSTPTIWPCHIAVLAAEVERLMTENERLEARLDRHEPRVSRFVDHAYSEWLFENWQRLANLPDVRRMFRQDQADTPAERDEE